MVDETIPSVPAFQPRLKARLAVKFYVESLQEKTDPQFTLDADKDIYVVWFAKTLQNWKALLSTTLPDGMYYEATYNGDLGVMYLDAYKKVANMTFDDEDLANV